MISQELVDKYGEKGANLVDRLDSVAKTSSDIGWDLTKKAMGIKDEKEQNMTVNRAEEEYKRPLYEIINQMFLLDSIPENLLREIKVNIVKVGINVFDLYRRVNRLEEAEELGLETLGRVKEVDDLGLVLRAGNFFTLVQSAKAYELIGKEDYEGALSKFYELKETFELMPLDKAEGKNAVMLYTNYGAVPLRIAQISRKLDVPLEDITSELDLAMRLTKRSDSFLDSLKDPQDKATWSASNHITYGGVAKYKEDFDIAFNHFETALTISMKDSEYLTQIASLQTELAHILVVKPNPDTKKAKQYFTQVEKFLEKNDFNVYDFYFQPLLKEIREKLN